MCQFVIVTLFCLIHLPQLWHVQSMYASLHMGTPPPKKVLHVYIPANSAQY